MVDQAEAQHQVVRSADILRRERMHIALVQLPLLQPKRVADQRGISDVNSPASKAMIEYTWGKIWNSKAYNACSNMPRAGHMGILSEVQVRHVVGLLLDPKSPVNQ